MNAPQGPAAPASGTQSPLHHDPEIAASLEFEPVPRKLGRVGGWTAEAQRAFIAALAATGSPRRAAAAIDMREAGVKRLREDEGGESFAAAWDRAMAVHSAERNGRLGEVIANAARKLPSSVAAEGRGQRGLPGQMLNEFGEWEDEDSIARRAEEARDSISNKLRRARRLYLREISECPGKRAAFEILTELPVDWDKAERLEPQLEEPWRRVSMREPDMLLAAEAGWLGDVAHGRNRIADRMVELRKAMDDYHAEHGLPPIDWDSE